VVWFCILTACCAVVCIPEMRHYFKFLGFVCGLFR